MRLFITGSSGFIGQAVVRNALLQGFSLSVMSRYMQYDHIMGDAQIVKRKSLLDIQVCDLEGCDAVIHLAAHTANPPYAKLSTCIEENAIATLHLLEMAKKARIKKFVLAGSCFEYGISGNEYERIPTDARLKPTNTYAISKALCSTSALQWSKQHQLNIEVLRLFHVFGPGEKKTRFWPSLREAAKNGKDFRMSKGEQVRDFLYIDEVADLFIERANVHRIDQHAGLVKNIVSTNQMTLADFAKIWWKKWNAKGRLIMDEIPYRKEEVMRYVGGDDCIVLKSKWNRLSGNDTN